MRALYLDAVCDLSNVAAPLRLVSLAVPQPAPGEVRVRINACAVCHTELDEIEGRTPPPFYPVIPGHQVVGVVDALGPGVTLHEIGTRVGVGWIFSACGECAACQAGDENLCPHFEATGRDHHGGYAEYLCVPEASALELPGALTDLAAAPMLCAGAIGYRSLRLAGLTNGQRLGLTGFGASAHLVLQLARQQYPDSEVHVFARSETERAFALELGATWVGDTADSALAPLDAIIDTTPAWQPIVAALAQLAPGGRLIINAIRKQATDKEALLALDYPNHLWLEKEIKSVANVTRRDIAEFLGIAAALKLEPAVTCYPLEEANRALQEVKQGGLRGAKVLVTGS